MAGLGVVAPIATDANDDFVRANLVKQAWKHRRIILSVYPNVMAGDAGGDLCNEAVGDGK